VTRRYTKGSLEESFRAKFEIDFWTGCWLWTACTDDKGYGRIRHGGKEYAAHRLSYELFVGPIPPGEGYHGTCVMHLCDTPGCVCPEHLTLGTNLDNILDMRAKGRDTKGEERYNAKLTEEDVANIKKDTRYQYVIAAQYGVNQSQISRIKNDRRWRHTNRIEVASGR
jgi:hypothetical protein